MLLYLFHCPKYTQSVVCIPRLSTSFKVLTTDQIKHLTEADFDFKSEMFDRLAAQIQSLSNRLNYPELLESVTAITIKTNFERTILPTLSGNIDGTMDRMSYLNFQKDVLTAILNQGAQCRKEIDWGLLTCS